MTRSDIWACASIGAFVLGLAVPAGAGLTAAQKCEKLKDQAAAKRALCTAVQRGKEIAGKPFDYAKCATKMADVFSKREAKGACPTSGDAADVGARIDGIFNPSSGIPKALSGVRFIDNGDGTVTDTQTGLMWEMKDNLDNVPNAGDANDADNTYTWNTAYPGSTPNGTVFTDFLGALNDCTYNGSTFAGGFAGHCDWRLPTQQELLAIVDLTAAGCGNDSPCIPAIFGPTRPSLYWSSATSASFPASAWGVYFFDGTSVSGNKANDLPVRAVRTGP